MQHASCVLIRTFCAIADDSIPGLVLASQVPGFVGVVAVDYRPLVVNSFHPCTCWRWIVRTTGGYKHMHTGKECPIEYLKNYGCY